MIDVLELQRRSELLDAVVYRRIDFPDRDIEGVYEFISRLRAALSEAADSDHWNERFRQLRQLRWLLASSPIPARANTLRRVQRVAELRTMTPDVERNYPAVAGIWKAGIDHIESLAGTAFHDALIELLRRNCDVAGSTMLVVLACDSGPAESLQKRIASMDGLVPERISIRRWDRRSTPPIVDHAIFAGPARWFGDNPARWVPAKTVTWLCASHLKSAPLIEPLWVEHGLSHGTRYIRLESIGGAVGHEDENAHTFDEDPPAAAAAAWALKHVGQTSGPDAVDAYIAGFSDGSFAYLTHGMTVNVSSSGSDALEPGAMVVLREGKSGTSAIHDAADAHLGQDAASLRARQEEWKENLYATSARRGGDSAFAISLKEKGIRVQAHTIRRWASDPDLIRPNNKETFLRTLTECGYSADEAARIVDDMSRIRSAHVKAGHMIRERLLWALEDAATSALDSFEMHIPELGEVRLTAYRIMEVLPARVRRDELGIRFLPGAP